METIPTQGPDYKDERSSAEMVPSRDGRFLYASNHGEDTIVVFSVDPASGRLAALQRIPAGGRAPWSMALVFERTLASLATDEASDHVAVFHVDRSSGRLKAVGAGLSIPKPVAALFVQA